jgi:hypothetical protein
MQPLYAFRAQKAHIMGTMKTRMKNQRRAAKKQGFSFLGLGLAAFLCLGLEAAAAFWVEPALYAKPMAEWGAGEFARHWILTGIAWLAASFALASIAKNRLGMGVLAQKEKPGASGWAACLLAVAASAVASAVNWHGFKPFLEFQNLGWPSFAFQYMYYAFEAALVFLMLAFGQEAGERLFPSGKKSAKAPWGGAFVGLVWGMSHALTQGGITAGLFSCYTGILFGAIYLGAKKNARVAFPLIFAAFVL